MERESSWCDCGLEGCLKIRLTYGWKIWELPRTYKEMEEQLGHLEQVFWGIHEEFRGKRWTLERSGQTSKTRNDNLVVQLQRCQPLPQIVAYGSAYEISLDKSIFFSFRRDLLCLVYLVCLQRRSVYLRSGYCLEDRRVALMMNPMQTFLVSAISWENV